MAIQPVSSLKNSSATRCTTRCRISTLRSGETEHYVVNVLTMFLRRRRALRAPTKQGATRQGFPHAAQPLAIMLGEALEAPTSEARFRGLQRLGDVSLFIAGFFSAGFARKLVDVDYHIAMGGQAYGTLAESCPPARARTLRQVFAELAAKFQPMVDALNEISESAYQHTDRIVCPYRCGETRQRALAPAVAQTGSSLAAARACGPLISAPLSRAQGALANYDLRRLRMCGNLRPTGGARA